MNCSATSRCSTSAMAWRNQVRRHSLSELVNPGSVITISPLEAVVFLRNSNTRVLTQRRGGRYGVCLALTNALQTLLGASSEMNSFINTNSGIVSGFQVDDPLDSFNSR